MHFPSEVSILGDTQRSVAYAVSEQNISLLGSDGCSATFNAFADSSRLNLLPLSSTGSLVAAIAGVAQLPLRPGSAQPALLLSSTDGRFFQLELTADGGSLASRCELFVTDQGCVGHRLLPCCTAMYVLGETPLRVAAAHRNFGHQLITLSVAPAEEVTASPDSISRLGRVSSLFVLRGRCVPRFGSG